MIKKIRLLQVIPNMGIGGAETGCRHIAEHVSSHGEFSAIMTTGGKQLELLSKSIKVFKWTTSKNIFLWRIREFQNLEASNLIFKKEKSHTLFKPLL